MARRIFVGLPLDSGLTQKAEAFRSQHADWAVRWVTSKNLHVTLVPPWPAAEAEWVRERLSQVAGSAFALDFKGLGLGPDPSHPRLVWALGSAPDHLANLRQKLFAALGQALEPRPFRPHITLARLERSEQVGNSFAVLPQRISWQMEAVKFCLYESFLKPGGADYRVLAEYSLSS